MGHATVVEQVRELVRHQFQQLNISTEAGVEETILIRNGFYCGRRFTVAQAHAIWFCEEDQLKLYGPDGSVTAVLRNVQQRLLGRERPLSEAA